MTVSPTVTTASQTRMSANQKPESPINHVCHTLFGPTMADFAAVLKTLDATVSAAAK